MTRMLPLSRVYHREDDQTDMDPDDDDWEPSDKPEACLRCGEDLVWSDLHAAPLCNECVP